MHTWANAESSSTYLETASQAATQRAIDAAILIEQRLSTLREIDFQNTPAKRQQGYGGVPISDNASYLDCLRTDLRSAFAEIDLAKQFPGSTIKSDDLFDILVNGSEIQFFGSNGHIDQEIYLRRSRLLNLLLSDPEIQFADRIFMLPGDPSGDRSETLERWLAKAKHLISPNYLGTSGTLSTSQQSRCVRTLYLLKVMLQSQHVVEASTENTESYRLLRQFIDENLADSLKKYVRKRFVENGAMRDRTLPILRAAMPIIPELDFDVVGVAPQKSVQKMALNHARGLAELVAVIDAPMADVNLARKAINQIIDYRAQPYYIGSHEIREKGTIPCEADRELAMIINRANFFGDNGHRRGTTYRKRVKVLEQLFLSPSSLEIRDLLFSIQTPEEWIFYFENALMGKDESGSDTSSLSCFEAIRKGAIRPLDMKNLFLARCMLSHTAFDALPRLKERRDALKAQLQEQAPILAVEQFKAQPRDWNKVDLAFVEISKLVPGFKLINLSIPTYRQYLGQRDTYESVLWNLPDDFLRLTEPESHLMVDNQAALFQSDYVYRIGKFNKRLSPGFVKDINDKLKIIVEYRNSQFTPPDRRIRPGFASAGQPIRELMVMNRHYPYESPGNAQLHDLLEGRDGGLGGLGVLFLSDPRGYESRETALDAIASCRDLQLADTLFALAMDAGIDEPNPRDKAAAAKRWLHYFRKTQSLARFRSTPEELSNAIRGAFLCRLIVQSDDFLKVVEHSTEEGVGSATEISSALENTLTSQVRIMNSVLSSIDPSTALNKNVETIKKRWYELKAWHTESTKWLETVVADPLLMAEISRIRSLNQTKTESYADIVPAITELESTLEAVEPRILAERHSEQPNTMFSPLDFAKLVMSELLTLEKQPGMTVTNPEVVTPTSPGDEKRELSQKVTRQLFLDIRNAVKEAGFDELSEVTSRLDFPRHSRAYLESPERSDQGEDAIVHQMLLQRFKGAVANAKGRIEAERTTDLKTLEEHSIRAARADRIYFAGDRDRYSLLIDPSQLLHEWNNRHKLETIAEFRTVETRAQAQTQVLRLRRERKKLEQDREFLETQQRQLDARLAQARKWSIENGLEFDPDAVINEMLAMENKINSLKGEIVNYQRMEEKYREHHFDLAQQLHSYRIGHAISARERKKTQQKEMLLAKAERELQLESGKKTKPKYKPKTYHQPKPQPVSTYQASVFQPGTFSKPLSRQSRFSRPIHSNPVASFVPRKPTASRPVSSQPTSTSIARSRSYTSQRSAGRSSSGSLIQQVFGRNRRR